MISDYIFEIDCLDEIGNYKLADELNAKIIKLASANANEIRKQVIKKFKHDVCVKKIHFNNNTQKFTVFVSPEIPSDTKTKIRKMTKPFGASFRCANSNYYIDHLFDDHQSPEDKSIEDLLKKFPNDYISMEDMDEMEPTDEELRYTAEFPDDDSFDEGNILDQLSLIELLNKHR